MNTATKKTAKKTAKKAISEVGGAVQIVFTCDHEISDAANNENGRNTKYKKGDKLTCNEASANHFLSRGVAKRV